MAAIIAASLTFCHLPSLEPSFLEFGIHTLRGSGKELQLVHDAGFDWVVQVFSWSEIARWRDLYNWEHPDSVVRGAEYFGLNLVVRLDQHPDWARSRPAENGPPDDLEDYGDFVYAVASRYKGRIKGYIIWNEPNLALEWGGEESDPQAYVEMLKVAHARIKEADPQALVVSAGLAPTNHQSAQALDDRIYLQRMYEAGAGVYFDVLGAHAYGFGHSPTDPRGAHQGLNLARVEDLREILVAHGDAAKPVWVTELGWTVAPEEDQSWQRVSPQEQADYLVGAYERATSEWPWIQLVSVWNVGLNVPSDDPMGGYSLVDAQRDLRPAYSALQEMPKGGTLARMRGMLHRCQRVLTDAGREAGPRALAEDVIIHLGDNHWPTPWVPLYQGELPSPIWTGELLLRDPGEHIWALHIDVMQNNERTNYLLVNGHPVDPPYFPVEDYSRSWVSLTYEVPYQHLRSGLNEITVVVGKEIPARHGPGSYEDLQFRDILLERGQTSSPD